VEDTLCVRVVERLSNLSHDSRRVFGCYAMIALMLSKVMALNVLGHHIGRTFLRVTQVVDRDDPRMIQLGQETRFRQVDIGPFAGS
jgi:hypothetical protein